MVYVAIAAAVGGGTLILTFLFRKWFERRWGYHDESDEENIKGRIVVVTGANAGLGYEAAYEFARRGATVVLACRDMFRAEEAMLRIRERTSNGNLVVMGLDLASLDSIRQFARQLSTKYEKIDILVNNAGVFAPRSKKLQTKEGFEIHFGVNHLGHFLLTNLLLEKLKKGAPSRIVMVASTLSEKGKLDFDDLMLEKAPFEENESIMGGKYNPYGNSKLANILFARELAKRLKGTGVHTYAVCPGWVKTDLGRNTELTWKNKVMMVPAMYLFMRSLHQGVQSILHCALSNQTANETGKLYRNCDHWVTTSDLSDNIATQLWEASEELVGMN